jgi:hypothetical protein
MRLAVSMNLTLSVVYVRIVLSKWKGIQMAEPLLHTLRQLSADTDVEIGLLAYDEQLIRLIRTSHKYADLLMYVDSNY